MKTTIELSNGLNLDIEHDLPLYLKEGDSIKIEIPTQNITDKTKSINNKEYTIVGIWKTVKDIDAL